MRYCLENENFKVEIDNHGAELKSVQRKLDGREYMWQADPKFWGRTSPVLFPFVGGLRNKEYRYQGQTYSMGQHGFARDMDFELVSQNDSEIWFKLQDTPETLAKFPLAFVLEIGYVLKDNSVEVLWKVTNPADGNLYFSIGAHPAFNCPLHGEENKAGYQLVFPGKDVIHHYGNENAGGLADTWEDNVLNLTDGKVTITPDFFDRCTYMVDGHQAGEVGIIDPQGNQYVTVKFDMPLFAIWSPEKKNAPFVCIEPWCGRCDASNFEGTLEEREHGNTLAGGETFETGYTMIFA